MLVSKLSMPIKVVFSGKINICMCCMVSFLHVGLIEQFVGRCPYSFLDTDLPLALPGDICLLVDKI